MIKKGRLLNYAFLNDLTVQAFDGEKLYISTGNSDDFLSGEKVTYEKKPSRANLQVDEGTVLFAKMKGTRKTLLIDEKMKENIYSTGFFALKSNFFVSKYLYYLIASDEFNKEKDSYSFGTTQEAINEIRLKKINIEFVTNFELQQTIANYLDEQVLKIDELIVEQKQAIENWKAYKQSLITEKVTKGLNPSVEMKDSGIEWIGKIPSHWEVRKLKSIISQKITDGPHETPEFIGDGVPFLSVDAIVDGKLSFEKCRYISEELSIEYFKKCKPQKGDLLMGKSASTGKICIVETDIIFNIWSPLALIRVDKKISNGKFVEYHLKSLISQYEIDINCTHSTQKNIGMETISNLVLLSPPLHEQQAIANYLDEKCSKIDELIEQKQVFINQLEEYKQSLIYECVTGKRCVL